MIWDVTSDSKVKRHIMKGHHGAVNHIAFSSDNIAIATASDDHSVRLWNRSTGKQIAKLHEPGDGKILTCHYSPDGVLIAALVGHEKVRIWNSALQCTLTIIEGGHTLPIKWCTFSVDAQYVVTASDDTSYIIWDYSKEEPVIVHHAKGAHTSGIKYIAFSPSGKFLASAGYDKTIHVWR